MIRPEGIEPKLWDQLRPMLESMETGGCVMICLEPLKTENTPRLTRGAFSAMERKTLKTALLKARTLREKTNLSER